MEREKDFRSYLVTRNADEKTQNFSVELVDDFLSVMEEQGMDFPENDLADIKYYAHNKIAGKPDAYERIIGLARYCRFSNHDAGLFYLVTMCGTIGVLDSMQARMRLVLGDEEADKIISTMKNPPLGSVYEAYPEVVNSMLSVMQRSLPIKTCRKILAGNHHGIPVEKFNYDKEKFKELGSIDDYLKFRTSSMLEEMELCMNEGRMWYEQKITPRVLEFVRANPEIQAGVREGNTVYITKIPYDPEAKRKAVSCMSLPVCAVFDRRRFGASFTDVVLLYRWF